MPARLSAKIRKKRRRQLRDKDQPPLPSRQVQARRLEILAVRALQRLHLGKHGERISGHKKVLETR